MPTFASLPSTAALTISPPSKGMLELAGDVSMSDVFRALALEQRLYIFCFWLLEDFLVRPLRAVVCPPVQRRPRVRSLFEVSRPLPEGFGGNEGRCLLVRHDSDASLNAVRSSILRYPHSSLRCVILGADAGIQTTVTPPSSVIGTSIVSARKISSTVDQGVPVRS